MAKRPYRETRPYVGFRPTIPQNDAGWRMEPPVSDPSAAMHSCDATAAVEPPEEPPGTRSKSCGFFTGPKYEVSLEEPQANSSILALPKNMASESFNFFITVASYGAI